MSLPDKWILDQSAVIEYLVNDIFFTWAMGNHAELRALENLIHETQIKKVKLLKAKEFDVFNCSVQEAWQFLSVNISEEKTLPSSKTSIEEKTLSNSEELITKRIQAFEDNSTEEIFATVDNGPVHVQADMDTTNMLNIVKEDNNCLCRIYTVSSKLKVPLFLAETLLYSFFSTFCKQNTNYKFRFLHDPGGNQCKIKAVYKRSILAKKGTKFFYLCV